MDSLVTFTNGRHGKFRENYDGEEKNFRAEPPVSLHFTSTLDISVRRRQLDNKTLSRGQVKCSHPNEVNLIHSYHNCHVTSFIHSLLINERTYIHSFIRRKNVLLMYSKWFNSNNITGVKTVKCHGQKVKGNHKQFKWENNQTRNFISKIKSEKKHRQTRPPAFISPSAPVRLNLHSTNAWKFVFQPLVTRSLEWTHTPFLNITFTFYTDHPMPVPVPPHCLAFILIYMPQLLHAFPVVVDVARVDAGLKPLQ